MIVGHSGRAKWTVSLANSLRAVPSLGLLFAVALWLGPKIASSLAYVIPSVIVLVLLAVPPILSGTYAGIQGVDPAARDAAKGMGMRGSEVLRKVELPCSLPLLLSGIRSATLQVIATATIAASISLGRPRPLPHRRAQRQRLRADGQRRDPRRRARAGHGRHPRAHPARRQSPRD